MDIGPYFDPGSNSWLAAPSMTPRPITSRGYYNDGPNISKILANTLEEIGTQGLPLTVNYDEDGNPSVEFAPDALRKTAVLPLTACARGVEGVCGVSIGTSGNAYGGGLRGSVDVYADKEANFMVLLTGGGGGYTPLPGSTNRLAATGIPGANLADLDGVSGQFGLSGASGAVGGVGEAVFMRSDQGVSLRGQSYGYAYGLGAEIHLTITYSQPLYISQ